MFISIITPTYNEVENLPDLIERISTVMHDAKYDYEHLIIDNCSDDGTIGLLRQLAKSDHRIKVILNARNFGPLRSFYHALMSAQGDVCIMLASDLQDPPELIPQLVKKWEEGYKIVLLNKTESDENKLMFAIRRLYYRTMKRISSTPIISNATGAGLYDRLVIEQLRTLNDPIPYFRGLLGELGHPIATIPFRQPARLRGLSKSKFFTLYDIGMLGITNHSKVPMRIMTMMGFIFGAISFTISLSYLIAKFIFWNSFDIGIAPILIGVFFFMSVQLFFLGVLGEYVVTIHTRLRNFPHVIESERINF